MNREEQVGWAKGLYPVPIKFDQKNDGHVVPPLPILRGCYGVKRGNFSVNHFI